MYMQWNIKNKRILISNDLIIVNEKSVGVRVKRSDGVLLPKCEYFPRYTTSGETLVEVISDSTYTTIEMPQWLYNKRINSGFEIVT